MEFEVDTNANEDAIEIALKRLPLTGMKVRRVRLDVGDIICRFKGGVLVFERKTWADLRSSIMDSRASDQKARQKRFIEETKELSPECLVRIVYVIQGPIPSWAEADGHSTMPNARLYQSLFMSQMRDGIDVIHLRDAEDIAKAIAYISHKAAHGELSHESRRMVGGAVAHSSKKRKNTESETDWYNMLCAIHGVGEKKARCITEAYPTAKMLIEQYLKHPDSREERLKVVSRISSGKKAVGKSVAEKVHQALFG